MRATQGQELVTRDEPVRVEVLGEFARIQAAEEEAASSVTMLALVNRAQARLEIALPTEPAREINAVANVVEVPEMSSAPAVTAAAEAATTEEKANRSAPATVATSGPTAESAADENQSFPL
jgi:hypothetical protein